MHSYDRLCADVCPCVLRENSLSEQELRSNGNSNFFADLFLRSLRKCDAILSGEWGEICYQLGARTPGQSFIDAYRESSFLIEGYARRMR
jgi:hypothetical protein